MRDYISREAAIKALCEWSEPCFKKDGEPTFIGDYIGAIASIPAADVMEARRGEWISTAERQPEKSGLYLTYHPRHSSMTMYYSAKNKAWNAFDSEDEPKYALEVTHWLPLPEPPEEE